jgi:uncharacterized protein (TIGR02145 family)
MKIKSIVCTILVTGLLLTILSGCKKETIKMATVVTNATVTNISAISALCSSEITSDGGSSIISRGVCWSTFQSPSIKDLHTTDGSGVGSFTSRLTGLKANTTYYLRSYATNSEGIAFGNEIFFKTNESGSSVTDIDGNVYYTVTIGTQEWMVENLKTTKYRNGDPILNITKGTGWGSLSDGAYCSYNNDANKTPIYGLLYNWYAVNDSRNIAPVGWHVPSDAEWSTLITFLGGESLAGDKLKETGTTHWTYHQPGTTNETGFTALPAGHCDLAGSFFSIRENGHWWSSDSWFWSVYDHSGDVGRFNGSDNKRAGLSVRCVKD